MMSFRHVRATVRSWLGARSHQRRVSRGQALVEFSLFVPLFMFMIVGATDISTLLDDHLNVVYAARAGARVGSVIGNYYTSAAPYVADCAVVGAVQAALTSTRGVQIQQIAIFDSNSQGQPVTPAKQDTYPGNAVCNANGSISPPATHTGWAPGPLPGGRCNVPFIEDSIGVSITYTYTFAFNPLGGGTTTPIVDSAVMPIEIVVNPQSTSC